MNIVKTGGLGVKMPDKLNWEVLKYPNRILDSTGKSHEVPGQIIEARIPDEADGPVFAQVGNSYEVIQNKTIWDKLTPIHKHLGPPRRVRAGMICAAAWDVPDINSHGYYSTQLVASWGHNGTHALSVRAFIRRLACANLVAFMKKSIGGVLKIKHSTDANSRLSDVCFEEYLTYYQKQVNALMEDRAAMRGVRYTKEKFRTLYGKVTQTKTFNGHRYGYAEHAYNQEGGQSLYDAYNAITQTITHFTRDGQASQGTTKFILGDHRIDSTLQRLGYFAHEEVRAAA